MKFSTFFFPIIMLCVCNTGFGMNNEKTNEENPSYELLSDIQINGHEINFKKGDIDNNKEEIIATLKKIFEQNKNINDINDIEDLLKDKDKHRNNE